MPALFAVESGASVKQAQPPVIQGKRQDETLLSGMMLTDKKVSSWIRRIPLILRFEQFPRFTKYHPE